MPNGEETSFIPKREESREDLASSLESQHDDEQQLELHEAAGPGGALRGSPVQKRKGGRKAVYQTTEEKKQRNRRAQAAFRERRTEHIKQLETDKRHLEDRVESMEAGQRKDKDENLMLRYKNSLLERILVEHNIDFRLEIQQKGLSYSPPQVPVTTTQAPIHRSVLQRPRPKQLALDTRAPGLRRSDSNAAASAASSSPVVPSNAPFTFTSPIQMPQSAGASLTGGPQQYLAGVRQAASMPSVPNPPLSQRRQSIPNAWPSNFESGLRQQGTPFTIEADSFPVQPQSDVSLLQAQFAGSAGGQQQFGLLGHGQFPPVASSMGQVIDREATAAAALEHAASHQAAGLEQTYAMMGELTGYSALQDSDPFGIDRSMQYPTQFDFPGGQRKQQ